jgi:hypothetical protein
LVNGTFALCADGERSRIDLTAMMSKVLGLEIRAQKPDPASLRLEATPMKPMFEHDDRAGLRGNPLTLRVICECEPRTVFAFFE